MCSKVAADWFYFWHFQAAKGYVTCPAIQYSTNLHDPTFVWSSLPLTAYENGEAVAVSSTNKYQMISLPSSG